jgi:tRNA(Leu) C34 or U34 (ribose-2'-O)-methylase TrmL
MHLALFQPDIPANAGAIMRLAACLDLPLAIIEPCGFILDDRRLRRAALDYSPISGSNAFPPGRPSRAGEATRGRV